MQSKNALTAATEESSSSEVDVYVITVAAGTFYTTLAIGDSLTLVLILELELETLAGTEYVHSTLSCNVRFAFE
jgi:hypothetical protein